MNPREHIWLFELYVSRIVCTNLLQICTPYVPVSFQPKIIQYYLAYPFNNPVITTKPKVTRTLETGSVREVARGTQSHKCYYKYVTFWSFNLHKYRTSYLFLFSLSLLFWFVVCYCTYSFVSCFPSLSLIGLTVDVLAIIISNVFVINSLSLYTPRFRNTVTATCPHNGFGVYQYKSRVVLMSSELHIQ